MKLQLAVAREAQVARSTTPALLLLSHPGRGASDQLQVASRKLERISATDEVAGHTLVAATTNTHQATFRVSGTLKSKDVFIFGVESLRK